MPGIAGIEHPLRDIYAGAGYIEAVVDVDDFVHRAAVRAQITPLDRDRYLKADLDAALELCESGAVLAAVEAAVGPLE